MKKYIHILIIMLLILSCGVNRNISKNKAERLAEKYLIEQGWADKEIDTNVTKVDLTGIDLNYHPLSEHLKLRYNSLIPKAVYSKRNGQNWIIGFRYNPNNRSGISSNDTTIGRAVIVSDNGKEVHMIWELFNFIE